METQKLTGYPSIDKPWLKYYSKEAIQTPLTEASVYEYLLENNQKAEDLARTALVYNNRKISYKMLFDGIERTARAFHHIGFVQGNTVACIAPSFPETIYSFYAVNKLGGISDYFDPRADISDIRSELQEVRPIAMLIYEDFMPKFQTMIDELHIPH
ncbi:MAG: AMP-binding protein, partial [Lachnospiraceae bacterium]|nr:AMP-binding protein [Lachnospiraceae bacterium]